MVICRPHAYVDSEQEYGPLRRPVKEGEVWPSPRRIHSVFLGGSP